MSDGILAAYLLGYDSSLEETARLAQKVKSKKLKVNSSIKFADGDDKSAEKAGPVDLRFDVAPAEAIDYFQRKKIVTQKEFDKLSREAKAGAFYVSGVYKKDILTAFKQEISDALETGQTQKHVVDQFKDILDGAAHRELGDFHLETVVRSNMMTAYGVGRRKAMEDTADLLPFWEYSAVGDDRTRPTHRALDGIIFPANHEFWDEHYPPWGFNCFLPGTKIEGRFQLGFRSWYDGKAVEITTRSGNRMRVTANHPILTVNGFVAAQSLNQGDNVLSYIGGRKRRLETNGRRESSVGVSRTMQADVLAPNENVNDSPMTVEQVFSSLLQMGNMARFPVAPDDFHRDAMFGNGYVEVVNPNGKLRNDIKTGRLQGTQNNILESVNAAFIAKDGFGAFRSGVESVLTSAPGIPSGTTLTNDTGRTALDISPLNLFLLGTASQINARRNQFTSDFGTREAEFAAELQDRYAALVTADEIIEIRYFDFCGHVYDFQTEGGWIVADDIFASNCRCSVIALIDMPDGYNHAKPNPDTTIAYDEKGLPAKAEYLTQVVDLKATKFVGVPRTASLEDVLKQSANRAQQAKRERDNYKTPQSVIEKAKEIRNEKVEVAHLFDAKGNHLLSARGTADEYEVNIPADLIPKFTGGIDVHNHPPEVGRNFESFSLPDVVNAADWELTETLVITKNYLYSMRPPRTGWSESWKQMIEDTYWRIDAEVMKDFYDRFRSGEMTIGQVKDVVRDKVWKLVAKELGLRYKRKKV